jgi:hypothetical protein
MFLSLAQQQRVSYLQMLGSGELVVVVWLKEMVM